MEICSLIAQDALEYTDTYDLAMEQPFKDWCKNIKVVYADAYIMCGKGRGNKELDERNDLIKIDSTASTISIVHDASIRMIIRGSESVIDGIAAEARLEREELKAQGYLPHNEQ